MGEKKPPLRDFIREKFLSGGEGPAPETPKKYCVYCESETSTWGFCDQCGRLFWGRIAWDLVCGGVCIALALDLLLIKTGASFYEEAIAVFIGGAGVWVTGRILRQLWLAYRFWQAPPGR